MTLLEVTARALNKSVTRSDIWWETYVHQAEKILPDIQAAIAEHVAEQFLYMREGNWGIVASDTIKEMK